MLPTQAAIFNHFCDCAANWLILANSYPSGGCGSVLLPDIHRVVCMRKCSSVVWWNKGVFENWRQAHEQAALKSGNRVLKGTSGGLRCTIPIPVKAYNFWSHVPGIPLKTKPKIKHFTSFYLTIMIRGPDTASGTPRCPLKVISSHCDLPLRLDGPN